MTRDDTVCERSGCKHRGYADHYHDNRIPSCSLVCAHGVKVDCTPPYNCKNCYAVNQVPDRCPFSPEHAVSQGTAK